MIAHMERNTKAALFDVSSRRRKEMISRRAVMAGGALALAGAGPLSRAALPANDSFLPQGLPQ